MVSLITANNWVVSFPDPIAPPLFSFYGWVSPAGDAAGVSALPWNIGVAFAFGSINAGNAGMF